jgi:hypothetical protein
MPKNQNIEVNSFDIDVVIPSFNQAVETNSFDVVLVLDE